MSFSAQNGINKGLAFWALARLAQAPELRLGMHWRRHSWCRLRCALIVMHIFKLLLRGATTAGTELH